MLYQASVEILDRGDAPAQEILDKNARSLAQRAADETKDELEKVMNRVEDIYQSFELVNALETNLASNLEYVDSIQELEEILSDTIKKNKYKQQVTIFIVGYQDVCQQKLTLLQQVNEFFMANSKSIDEEDWFPTTPDIDLEDVSNKIEDSLSTAEELTGRLGEINKEMVTYLTNYALNKGSHKAKKKVEKALQQAKDDINSLSEKLLAVQTEVEEKEEKIASLMKQGETRHMEIQRYKTAAEVAKKNMRDTEGMQEELTRRGALLDDANRRIESLQLELAQLSDTKAKSDMRLSTFSQDNVEKIEELQRLVQQKQLALDEAKRDLEKLHQMQILSLRDAHQAELEELQANHAEEIRRLLNEKEAAAPATDDQSVSSKTSSKDETRSTTKESQRSKSQVSVASKKSATTNVSKRSSRSSGKAAESPSKIYAEVSVQDEGGDPETATVSSHHLGVVRENTTDFQDTFELTDEEAWATVPTEQVTGRFSQFRELTRRKLSELQEQVSSTMTKTHRKVETLKAQFKQHKSKWEAERNVLVAQINQAIKLQSEAEQEADSAMGQLEDFIVEQEKLENLEDQRYLELSRATTKSAEDAQAELSALNTMPDQSDTLRSDVNSVARRENSATPIEITVHPDTTSAENLAQSRASEQSVGQTDGQVDSSRPRSSHSSRDGEPELTKLLQQTDDAKVQELRRSATTLSAAPTIETPAAEGGQRRSQSAQVVLKSTFEDILQNLKKSLNDETSLEPQQAKALDAVRRALRISANQKELSDIQLDKTLAIVSLAAQVAEESIRLAVKPSCFFDLFGKMNVEALTADFKELDFQESTDNEIGKAGENLEDEVLKYSLEKTAPRQNEHKEAVLSTLLDMADPKSSPVPPTVVLSEADLEKTPSTVAGVGVSKSRSLRSLPDIKAPGADVSPYGVAPDPKVFENLSFTETVDATTQWDRQDFMSRLSLRTEDSLLVEPAPNTLFLGTSTEEDFRAMMSRSRASLRSEYKIKLDENKLAADDRRSRSPAVSIPSLHSLDDDQLIDDEEEEEGLDFTVTDIGNDELSGTQEKGTSPPTGRRSSGVSAGAQSAQTPTIGTPGTPTKPHTPSSGKKSGVKTPGSVIQATVAEEEEIDALVLRTTPVWPIKGDHPIVQEYIKTYEGVMNFKDDVAKLLLDKDLMSASQIVSELEMLIFNQEARVLPQLENMSLNLLYCLDEITSVLKNVIVNDRDAVVSSLNMSRDPTRTNLITREKSDDSGRGLTGTRSRSAVSRHSIKSNASDSEVITELKATCSQLQRQLQMESKKHEQQIRNNTVAMMEMQETINGLQRELSELAKTERGSTTTTQEVEPSVMFTRLDSERNAKIMKRALFEDRLDTDKYKEAVNQMDQYVNIPAQRLGHLVRKYIHHRRMKQVEDNIRHSESLNDNVFEVLDKMETLQNKRAKQWTEDMDALGEERYRLASLLMDTFDNIEQESGIFLIKPIYSFKGREVKERYAGKTNRPQRHVREASPTREVCRSAYAPAPTPATGTRPTTRLSYQSRFHHINNQQSQSDTSLYGRSSQNDPSSGVTGLGMVWPVGQPRTVWSMSNSQSKELSEDNLLSYSNANYNTPRILELDINRMLIGQNNVSGRVRGALTDDRLLNASNNSVRSYVTVNRPTVAPGQSRFLDHGMVPPSSPYRPSSVQERSSERGERRKRIPSSPPLPPISLSKNPSSVKLPDSRSLSDLSYPPHSPPGSSLRLTPPLREMDFQSPVNTCS